MKTKASMLLTDQDNLAISILKYNMQILAWIFFNRLKIYSHYICNHCFWFAEISALLVIHLSTAMLARLVAIRNHSKRKWECSLEISMQSTRGSRSMPLSDVMSVFTRLIRGFHDLVSLDFLEVRQKSAISLFSSFIAICRYSYKYHIFD